MSTIYLEAHFFISVNSTLTWLLVWPFYISNIGNNNKTELHVHKTYKGKL